MRSRILSLYKYFGSEKYMIGEKVTQISHAVQTHDRLKMARHDKSLCLAGLLHDVGHFVKEDIKPLDPKDGVDDEHEKIGSSYLKIMGFTPFVTEPVELHVLAKRFLCSTSSDYYNSLSEASKQSFLLQGGILSKDEIGKFNNSRAIILRLADDRAKECINYNFRDFELRFSALCDALQID